MSSETVIINGFAKAAVPVVIAFAIYAAKEIIIRWIECQNREPDRVDTRAPPQKRPESISVSGVAMPTVVDNYQQKNS